MKINALSARRSMKCWATGTSHPKLPTDFGPPGSKSLSKWC